MSIKLGNIDVSYFKVGGADCSIYLGDVKMYPQQSPSFEEKYKLTLSDGSTVSAACDGTSAITSGEVSSQYSGTVVSAEIGDCVTTIGNETFEKCISLTSITIPDSVTTIGNQTFQRCISLTSITIPDSVTTIGQAAFQSCHGLTSVNIGSGVTSIGNSAFSTCSGLTSIDIPDNVTSIGVNAFLRCTSLTSVNIPSGVTTIGPSAFSMCSGLTSITVNATTPPSLGTNAFNNTNDCPIYVPCESVEAYKAANGWSTYASRLQCIPKPHDYSQDYLTFVALEDGTFSFSGSGSISANTLEYSVDSGSTWSTLQNSGTTPTVTSGNTILWKASGLAIGGIGIGIGKFSSTGLFEAEGNIMSLLFGDDFSGQTSLSGMSYVFSDLFSRTTIRSAENLVLPATTLAQGCYLNMFANCRSLTTAPQLPATTLASRCYQMMFQSCKSLTTAPELPATTLTYSCYQYMFQGCTSLTTAPVLSATTLTGQCYQNMFSGCTNLSSITCLATDISAQICTSNWVRGVAASGTFTKAASMTSWTEGTSGIPSGWTVVDYSG